MADPLDLPRVYRDRLDRAVSLLRRSAAVRIFTHYDADGLAAGAIVAKALRRAGFFIHLTAGHNLDGEIAASLEAEGNELVVLCDMGSGQLDAVERLSAPVIILDHHKPLRETTKADGVVQINPYFGEINGMEELCGASTAFTFALHLDAKNWDCAPLAIAGMTADRQHVQGFLGPNGQIVAEAQKRKLILQERTLNLPGGPVGEALTSCIDPYFAGLSGRPEAVAAFLKELKIDPRKPLRELDEPAKRRLATGLSMRLLRQGCRPETVEEITGTVIHIPSLEATAVDLMELLSACGRLEHPADGVAMALGDPKALESAKRLREDYQASIRAQLLRIEAEGVAQRDHIQHFVGPNGNLAGTQCGLAMAFLLDQSKPCLALASGNGKTRISSRGTRWLVSRGLDLAAALREAAAAVGGVGGGHPVASGATIPQGREEEFLSRVDAIVGAQLK